MPRLVRPTTAVNASFCEAMAEFAAEGRGSAEDDSLLGIEVRTFGTGWSAPEAFSEYVDSLLADELEETPRREGRVPATTLWYVEEARGVCEGRRLGRRASADHGFIYGIDFIGRLAILHRLTPHLRELGGHIGYHVRPSARRQGHATAMLRAALPVANALGVDPALITCDTDNVASRKVIEANGGRLEDEHRGKLRYWVPTS